MPATPAAAPAVFRTATPGPAEIQVGAVRLDVAVKPLRALASVEAQALEVGASVGLVLEALGPALVGDGPEIAVEVHDRRLRVRRGVGVGEGRARGLPDAVDSDAPGRQPLLQDQEGEQERRDRQERVDQRCVDHGGVMQRRIDEAVEGGDADRAEQSEERQVRPV